MSRFGWKSAINSPVNAWPYFQVLTKHIIAGLIFGLVFAVACQALNSSINFPQPIRYKVKERVNKSTKLGLIRVTFFIKTEAIID